MHRQLGAAAGAVLAGLVVLGMAANASAPEPPGPAQAVDFQRDVEPIFRQRCYACHGPAQQMNGFRLDRRRDALRGGTEVVIGPGNAAASRLYLRLTGSAFGTQMPPTGALPAGEVATIRAWIDQGAPWPDEASGEMAPTPVHPATGELIALLRNGRFPEVRARVARDSRLATARGPGGSTLLMFAALYGDLATLRELLNRGASVNMRNDAGATALMWAAGDLEKVRELADRGADLDARSDDGRTPLMIAAGRAGNAATVKFLVARGAAVNVSGPSLFGPTTPLIEALLAGDTDVFDVLVASSASLAAGGPAAVVLAHRAGCSRCAELVLPTLSPQLLTVAMMIDAPPTATGAGLPVYLARGASPDARDSSGRSPLMLVAASEALPLDAMKALLERQAAVNERTPQGDTALGLARRHGETSVVRLLREAGAADVTVPPAPRPTPARSAREALERALPLLQRSDATFLRKSGCVSCHNNSLTAMTRAAARRFGLRLDEQGAAEQKKAIAGYLEAWRERAIQGLPIPGDVDTAAYLLAGLAAEEVPADLATDAHAYVLKRQQASDGRWRAFAHRPPLEGSDITVTALSLRALQVYAPRARRAEYESAVAAAARWLRSTMPRTMEDRAFHLLGLRWAGMPRPVLQQVAEALVAEQREDGGWSQLQTMPSDAYATGQALVALVQSGMVTPTDAVYLRGAKFLLDSQIADGSWYVRSRAIPLQPLFDADFPHGPDAFISAAATNWAAMALALGPRTGS